MKATTPTKPHYNPDCYWAFNHTGNHCNHYYILCWRRTGIGPSRTQTFLLKDELNLLPAELSALTGSKFTLPWTIKPLYGFLSSSAPHFGYRRRSYFILCGILGCLSLGFDFVGVVRDNWTLTATFRSSSAVPVLPFAMSWPTKRISTTR